MEQEPKIEKKDNLENVCLELQEISSVLDSFRGIRATNYEDRRKIEEELEKLKVIRDSLKDIKDRAEKLIF